jgi:Ca2+-binding RTX toxin-like protein
MPSVIRYPGAELSVNSQASRSSPSVAALAGGGFVIVSSGENDGSGSGIWAQLFDAAGAKIGGELPVNSSVFSDQGQPAVAALAGGGFVVTWTNQHQGIAEGGDGSWNSVKGRLFNAAGVAASAEFLVNTATEGVQHNSNVVALASGGFAVSWSTGGGTWGAESDVKAQVFDSAATKVGAETTVNDALPGTQWRPEGAALASGGFVFTWQDGTGVKGQMFDAAGNQLGADFVVNTLAAGDQCRPEVAALANGGFVVTWQMADGGSYRAKAQIFDANGAKVGSEFLASTPGESVQEVTVAAGPGDSFLIGWSKKADFATPSAPPSPARQMAQLFDLEGNRLGDPSQINTGDFFPSLEMATLPSGLIVALWTGTSSMLPRLVARLIEPPTVGTAGADSIAGTVRDDIVFGLAGADIIHAGGGIEQLYGGAGSDILFYGAGLTADDSNDGGDGTDALVLQGDYAALVLGASSLVGIEVVSLQSGTIARWGGPGTASHDYSVKTVTANVAPGQQLRINGQSLTAGEDLTFDGSAETDGGRFLVYAGFGVDTLTGGAGNDIFYFEAGRFGSGDRIVGGAGNDAVVISGAPAGQDGPVPIDVAAGTLTGVESLSFNGRFATDLSARPSYEAVLQEGNIAEGERLIVNGSSLEAGQSLRFDASLVATGVLSLFGGAGADVLKGGANADLIYAAAGADDLTGGGGADVFQYRHAADSSVTSADTIRDFEAGLDKIDLSLIDANGGEAGDQGFTLLFGAFAGGAGKLYAQQDGPGGSWTIRGDTDGDLNADFLLHVFVAAGQPLTEADFIL